MLWHVTVEAWDATGNGDYYEVVTLAHSERGARSSATRAIARQHLTGAHSVECELLDVRETGVVFITKRHELPMFERKVST